jgi:hypothetical protein
MKLRRVQTYPPVLLKGHVPGELNIALSAYVVYYRETTGQTIELWPLVVQILEQFLDADRALQTRRRRTHNGPGAGPAKGQRKDLRKEGGRGGRSTAR